MASSTDLLELKDRIAGASEDSDELISLLQDLKTVEVSRQVLKATSIGLTVGQLTKHDNQDVRQLSHEVVKIWKSAIATPKDNKTQVEAKPTAKQHSTSSQDRDDGALTYGRGQLCNPHYGTGVAEDDDDARARAQGAQRAEPTFEYTPRMGVETPDDKRERTRQILFKAFESGCSAATRSDAPRLSMLIDEIEEEFYDYFYHNRQDEKGYWNQIRTLKSNLRDSQNTSFNDSIYQGSIDVKRLPTMTSQQMASEEKKRERADQLKESTEACQLDWEVRNIKRAKGQFTCGKCKSSDTNYVQMQTRSADEPMTTFVNCHNCGNRWKF